jgi:hypothetical protein
VVSVREKSSLKEPSPDFALRHQWSSVHFVGFPANQLVGSWSAIGGTSGSPHSGQSYSFADLGPLVLRRSMSGRQSTLTRRSSQCADNAIVPLSRHSILDGEGTTTSSQFRKPSVFHAKLGDSVAPSKANIDRSTLTRRELGGFVLSHRRLLRPRSLMTPCGP